MEQMNREQIVKALECCCKSKCSAENNADCPLINDEACACTLPKNALSLIREQNKQIDELMEDVARLSVLNIKIKKKTVRKMKSLLKQKVIESDYSVHIADIDQIEKEMLEGNDG